MGRTGLVSIPTKRSGQLPVKQIGEELNVGYVLEGTIRWDRGTERPTARVRITPWAVWIKVADPDSPNCGVRALRPGAKEDIFRFNPTSPSAGDWPQAPGDAGTRTRAACSSRHDGATDNMEAYKANFWSEYQYRWSEATRVGTSVSTVRDAGAAHVRHGPRFRETWPIASCSRMADTPCRTLFTSRGMTSPHERLAGWHQYRLERAMELQPGGSTRGSSRPFG